MAELDRRRNGRISLAEPVVLHRESGVRAEARCDNLSLGGASVITDRRLFHDERLYLETPFLTRDGRPLLLSCRVRYVVGLTQPGMQRAGLEFLGLSEESLAALATYITSHQALALAVPRPARP